MKNEIVKYGFYGNIQPMKLLNPGGSPEQWECRCDRCDKKLLFLDDELRSETAQCPCEYLSNWHCSPPDVPYNSAFRLGREQFTSIHFHNQIGE